MFSPPGLVGLPETDRASFQSTRSKMLISLLPRILSEVVLYESVEFFSHDGCCIMTEFCVYVLSCVNDCRF